MNTLRTIGSELLGLFVDDWAFAALIVIWVLVFVALARRLPHTPAVSAIFFAGFALITLVFALRTAKRHK